MPKSIDISVVKTAQTSSTLKLICEGSVAGSIVTSAEGHELRDKGDKVIGTFRDVDTALSVFKDWMEGHSLEAEQLKLTDLPRKERQAPITTTPDEL